MTMATYYADISTECVILQHLHEQEKGRCVGHIAVQLKKGVF